MNYTCNKRKIICKTSPTISTLSLTPGRFRNIDEDMQTLRLSRQDNPYIQVSKFDKNVTLSKTVHLMYYFLKLFF